MPITHRKVSQKTDSADASLIRPSDWNDTHIANILLSSEVSGILPPANGGTGYISITTYGAVSGGSVDCTSAFNLAFAAVNAQGFGNVYIPPGVFLINSALVLPTVPYTVHGAGMNVSKIYFGNAELFVGSAAVSGVEFAEFTVVGDWLSNQSDGGHHSFIISNADYVRFYRVGCDYVRTLSIATRNCDVVDVDSCQIRYSARDGISTGTCTHVKITNNLVYHCGDDGIANHAADGYTPVCQSAIITNNMLFDSYGINCLGAVKIIIEDNSLDLCAGHGINTGHQATEGNVGPVSLSIRGNVITDMINKFYVDGLLNQLTYINIQPPVASNGGVISIIPGNNDTVTGAVQTPYGYFYSQGATGAVQTGGYDVTVENNTLTRTRNVGDLYSSFGFGQMFSRNGFYDPTMTDNILTNGNGIVTGSSGGSTVRNMLIRLNTIRGIKTHISFSGPEYKNVRVELNRFIDFPEARAITLATGNQDIEIVNNYFDGDPFLKSTARSTNGSWTNVSTPSAIFNTSATGIKFIGNTIRNVAKPISGTVDWEENNLIECQFFATGYSASNFGVGNLPIPGTGYWYSYWLSDSSQVSWNILGNVCLKEKTSIPTTGYYVAGMFVAARSVTPGTSTGTPLGWLRLTTGNGHVLGTDWYLVAASDTLSVPLTITPAGTTGNRTINNQAGAVNFASGATSITVTNNLTNTSTLILALAQKNDTTGRVNSTSAASGSFTIFCTAPTAEMPVAFYLVK
jgi:hypothetical protein